MTANSSVSENALARIVCRLWLARAGLALRVIVVGACLLVASRVASAQGTSGIAGVVRDTSGAVLPGVTIEATSPALIEKVRTVVSDSNGEYKILSLPGGLYTVTFGLTGFGTVKREGIELSSNFTANVPVEMRVGQLSETVTVSGQAPVVDVQNAAQHKVVSGELLFALPVTKEMGGFATVTVGAVVQAVGQDVRGQH